MNIITLFPKYKSWEGMDVNKQRVVLRHVSTVLDTFVKFPNVCVDYAADNVVAKHFLNGIENKRSLTFVNDSAFLNRYNRKLNIVSDEVCGAICSAEVVKTKAGTLASPMKNPGESVSDWLQRRAKRFEQAMRDGAIEYLNKPGTNIITFIDNGGYIPFTFYEPEMGDGRLVIVVTLAQASFSVECYMGGVYIDQKTAVEIIKSQK